MVFVIFDFSVKMLDDAPPDIKKYVVVMFFSLFYAIFI